MIDLHSHILSGLDDGARDFSDSVLMAKAAYENGIRTIVTTPHHMNGHFVNPIHTVKDAVAELIVALKDEGIMVDILPGQEVRLYGEMIEDIKSGNVIGMAESSYILVEFPSSSIPVFAERILFDLQLNGLIPVIAHPERNTEIIAQPDKLYQLITKGCLSQITASSLTGTFGKKIKAFSHQLIKANLTHFIASDSHNTTTRPFNLNEAYNTLNQDHMKLLQENAEAVLKNSPIQKELPVELQKKLWGWR